MSDSHTYNYAIFPPATDPAHVAGFAEQARVGTPAPDGPLTLLDGGEIRLSTLWQDANLVVEFGSIT